MVLGRDVGAFRRACTVFCWVPAQGVGEVVVIFFNVVVFFVIFVVLERVLVAARACMARERRLGVVVHLLVRVGHEGVHVAGGVCGDVGVNLGVWVVLEVLVGVSAPRAHCRRLLRNGEKAWVSLSLEWKTRTQCFTLLFLFLFALVRAPSVSLLALRSLCFFFRSSFRCVSLRAFGLPSPLCHVLFTLGFRVCGSVWRM